MPDKNDYTNKQNNMKRRIHCVAILAVALSAAGCKGNSEGAVQAEYAVLPVDTSTLTVLDRYPASIRGRQDVEVYPQVSGKITEVCVKEGQRVRKGQTLFVIDQVPYKAALQTAVANLSAAKAEVATAQLHYEGKKELYDNQVTSLFEVRKAENALLSAEAAMEQAQAGVTDARNNLSYTVVASPCDGVAGTIPYRVGALVGPSSASPLTTVSDNSEMYVYFSIPENRMISLIRRYGSADEAIAALPGLCLFLNDGSRYEPEGRIESISGVLDAQTGSVSLRAVFGNPSGLLHSGGAGNVGIMEQASRVITVPQSATYELQDKVYVYRVIGGRAVATRIQADAVPEQKLYRVREGLSKGDTIVAEGVGLLRDGTPIRIKTVR